MARVPSLLDDDSSELSESARQMLADVSEYGFHIIAVYPSAEPDPDREAWEHVPNWTYTVGLFLTHGQPELVAFGLDHETASDVFWDLARGVESGRTFETGRVYDDALPSFDGPCAFEAVDPGWAASLFNRAAWFYKDRGFPIQQYLWPDRNGCWIWDEDVAETIGGVQPDLTRPPSDPEAPPVLPRV
jgi:hypothetical protein